MQHSHICDKQTLYALSTYCMSEHSFVVQIMTRLVVINGLLKSNNNSIHWESLPFDWCWSRLYNPTKKSRKGEGTLLFKSSFPYGHNFIFACYTPEHFHRDRPRLVHHQILAWAMPLLMHTASCFGHWMSLETSWSRSTEMPIPPSRQV